MAVSLSASEEGRKKIDQRRREKGWMATDPRWCEAAYTSPKTLTRFRRGQPIQQDTFINICQAVGVAWEDVVDRGLASPSVSIQWELRIEADDDLKDAIFDLIKRHSGDANLTLRKLEKGSLIFVLEGSLEGFERMKYLFSEGLISTLMDAQILSVRTRTADQPVRLGNWLRGNFEVGWQPPALALTRALTATESSFEGIGNILCRAKMIALETQTSDLTIQLLIQLASQEQDMVDIAIQVHPAYGVVYLPSGLQLAVIDPMSGLYEVVEALDQDNWLQLNIACERGEEFRVKVQLSDVVITEDFVV
ncbi:MAG: DUF1822 family protein [Cyanobacteria bacterium J06626_18]